MSKVHIHNCISKAQWDLLRAQVKVTFHIAVEDDYQDENIAIELLDNEDDGTYNSHNKNLLLQLLEGQGCGLKQFIVSVD
jgi:hypothetical protein